MLNHSIDKMYEAVVSCDGNFDGEFYYAVKTVGVYCRPSCRSRTPLKKNVEFFGTSNQAQAAGYRPCKRCRPDLLEYAPALELAAQTKEVIDGYYSKRQILAEQMCELGVSQSHLAVIFKQHYGMTPIQYIGHVRLEHAKQLLVNSDEQISFIAFDVGFDSLATFYRNFKKHVGLSPSDYRKVQSSK